MAGPLAPLGRLLGNAGRAARLAAGGMALPRAPYVLRVQLGSPVRELPLTPLWTGADPGLPLPELLATLRRAARDRQVAAVVLRSSGAPGGLARALALHRAIAELRAAGKPVIAWTESLGVADWLALAAADELLLPESGSVGWVGLRFEGLFLGDLLERLGVSAEVVRIGAYKTAGEMFTRAGLSEEGRAQLDELVQTCTDTVVETVAAARGLEPAALRALADAGPFPAQAAVREGLIDGCAYPDELPDRVRARVPALARRDPLPVVDGRVYAALRGADDGWLPLHRDLPRLAYVVAQGGVARGRGHRGVRAETMARLLHRLGADPGVAAVVLRVDSPGGDVVASDLVWRAVRRLAERKPVVASLGDTAASGGYYAAAAAHVILAEPTTVTGSIGVVGGKLDLSELYRRIGVGRDGVEQGARAGMLSESRGFTADERHAVRRQMEEAYERFLERVAEGRSLDREQVRAVAGGRVWSGRAALAHGLVDALGGPLEALAEARRRAGLAEREPAPVELHPRVPAVAGMRDWLRLLAADG